MGTNFYLLDKTHIGKQSAAGLYCWDCKKTLCKEGEKGLHQYGSEWHKKCPDCGKSSDETSPNAMMLQLGFEDPSKPTNKKGVTTICSFRWAIEPDKLNNNNIRKIEDKYGDKITLKEFRKMLDDWCPIQNYDMIGEEFI